MFIQSFSWYKGKQWQPEDKVKLPSQEVHKTLLLNRLAAGLWKSILNENLKGTRLNQYELVTCNIVKI